jgi:hypothetical protein
MGQSEEEEEYDINDASCEHSVQESVSPVASLLIDESRLKLDFIAEENDDSLLLPFFPT